jgi:hypothetical protein
MQGGEQANSTGEDGAASSGGFKRQLRPAALSGGGFDRRLGFARTARGGNGGRGLARPAEALCG